MTVRALSGALALAAAVFTFTASPTHSETPEEWIRLGACVHGAFGAFISVGTPPK
jgi:hypothetical protein